uniref:Uncharacterized protein n=1 Tax=Periophthalmus magnuspinnatus TaxID=409849 RepID=A0A3B4B1T8_9GOBI
MQCCRLSYLHFKPVIACYCLLCIVISCYFLLFPLCALCRFEGRQYALGESWMEDTCVQCTFHKEALLDFPAWCEVRVDPVTCKVSVVQTADPRLLCFPEDQQDPSHESLPLQQQLKE